MEPDESTIEDQATRLPPRARARLALKLIESLEPGKDEDVANLWLDEAERRLKEYEDGAAEAKDAEEALSEIQSRLK